MTIANLIEAYVDTLTVYVRLKDIFQAVDALIARDCTSRWWEEIN